MSPTRTHHDRRIGNGITIYFALVSDARACTARSIRGSSQRDCEACEVLGAWLGRTRPKIERVVPCVLHPQTRASGVKELPLRHTYDTESTSRSKSACIPAGALCFVACAVGVNCLICQGNAGCARHSVPQYPRTLKSVPRTISDLEVIWNGVLDGVCQKSQSSFRPGRLGWTDVSIEYPHRRG